MTELYGGAITAEFPDAVVDVSNFRPVPDTQEVFILEKPNGLDQLFIVDLLERVEASSLPEVLSVHLSDILEGTPQFVAPMESMLHPSLSSEIHTFAVKPPVTRMETDSAKLFMMIALLRLEKVGTDVVVTANVPVELSEPLTSDSFTKQVDDAISGEPTVLGESYKIIKHAALTLRVDNWDLFA